MSIPSIAAGGIVTSDPKHPQEASPARIWVTRATSNSTNRTITRSQADRGRSRARIATESSAAIATRNRSPRSTGMSRTIWGRSAGVPRSSLKSAPARIHRPATRVRIAAHPPALVAARSVSAIGLLARRQGLRRQGAYAPTLPRGPGPDRAHPGRRGTQRPAGGRPPRRRPPAPPRTGAPRPARTARSTPRRSRGRTPPRWSRSRRCRSPGRRRTARGAPGPRPPPATRDRPRWVGIPGCQRTGRRAPAPGDAGSAAAEEQGPERRAPGARALVEDRERPRRPLEGEADPPLGDPQAPDQDVHGEARIAARISGGSSPHAERHDPVEERLPRADRRERERRAEVAPHPRRGEPGVGHAATAPATSGPTRSANAPASRRAASFP